MKTNFKSLFFIIIFTASCAKNTDSSVLVQRINSTCNCEEVASGISANGITFSKKGKSSIGKRHEILLKNCEVSDYSAEVTKIAANLEKENLCKDVFIVLNFSDDGKVVKEFHIKNCQFTENE